MQINLVLFIILILGLIVGNNSLIISGGILLALKIFDLDFVLKLVDENSINLGIILIMLGVLAPLATGEVKFEGFLSNLANPLSLLAIGMGIAVTQFTREGLWLMGDNPLVTINLIVGVIVGVGFFNGVPSGPLIAGGITAVIYQFFLLIF